MKKTTTIKQDLLEQYRYHPTDENRNRVIEFYYPYIKKIALFVDSHICHDGTIELEDLINQGVIGLIDGLPRFDPTRQVSAKTFLAHRIKGAMLDMIRNLDWVPRLTRTRQTKLKKAATEFEITNGRYPNLDEIRKLLKASKHEMRLIQKDISVTEIIQNQEFQPTERSRPSNSIDTVKDKKQLTPYNIALGNDIKSEVISSLNGSDRCVFYYHYILAHPMKLVADLMKMSESRVSQLHSDLIQKLQLQFDSKKNGRPISIRVRKGNRDNTRESLYRCRGPVRILTQEQFDARQVA